MDIRCNHMWRVGARFWGRGIVVKTAKWSSEEFPKVSEMSCKYLSDFLLCLILSSDAVSLLCFSLHSLTQSRLDCSCSISALTRSFSHVDRLLVGPVPCCPCSTSALAHTRFFDCSWSDQYHMASSLGMRPQKPHPHN